MSIVTTDSTTSEDDIPPPLPVKTRDSSDYSNLPNSPNNNDNMATLRNTGKYKNKPLPAIPTTAVTQELSSPPPPQTLTVIGAVNQSYDYVETKNPCLDDKRRPPTPPPKPARNSKYVSV